MSIVASLFPIHLEHCGASLATIRAGGVGVLDAEFCTARHLRAATKNVRSLLKNVPAQKRAGEHEQALVGMRLAARQFRSHGALLDLFAGWRHWVVVCDWEPQELGDLLLKRLADAECLISLDGSD